MSDLTDWKPGDWKPGQLPGSQLPESEDEGSYHTIPETKHELTDIEDELKAGQLPGIELPGSQLPEGDKFYKEAISTIEKMCDDALDSITSISRFNDEK